METREKKVRGKLKIFIGYSAGIGKTYAMLTYAQEEKQRGKDIVAGYIESHERPDTIALLKGLEIIPQLEIKDKNVLCREFDLDAALKRKPQTILIDEMAHTNAAGSRHKKRYEDIEELIKAGINVYTTVNVQHIESLNDIVAGITGVSVRERIPDEAFDSADQIEMIDIPPEELITRLKAGKIYKPERVKDALDNFFTVENLTSLREIALRRMADRVNAEKEAYMEGDSAGSSEHILMCLSSSPSNQKVIRQAARMANAFHGTFTALYVETSDFSEMNQEDKKRLEENSRLAEQLGARVIISYGNDIVEQISEYAQIAKVTKIVLGRTYTKKSLFYVKESFSDRLVRISPNLEIFLIPDSYSKKYNKHRKNISTSPVHLSTDAGIDVSLLVLATIISMLFQKAGFRSDNLIMVYMIGGLLAALLAKYMLSSILYGIFSIFVFNYCFTEPVRTLHVSDPGYLVTFLVMFATSIIISTLVRKVKNAAKQAAEKSYRTEILLETSQKLQQAGNAEEIVKQVINQLGKLLNCDIYCFLGAPKRESKQWMYKVQEGEGEGLSIEEIAVAQWVYKNNKHAGASTTTLPGSKCLYLAIRNGEKIFAVVGIKLQEKIINSFEKSVMLSMLNEFALAFEKEEVLRKESETALKLKQEQLRANLLRAISHDLRTPLTSISGNADMLTENYKEMDDYGREQVFKDIYEDSIWLINLVENLLSVTRIENGAMKIHMQAELVDDIVEESIRHFKRHIGKHKIKVVQEDDILVVKMDAKLIMQVLANLLDNAVKHTPQESEILLHIFKKKDKVIFEVADNGTGVPEEQKEEIFSMFYTGEHSSSDGRRGMGMGLPLCKSIVEAHNGKIWVKDNIPKGTVFGFELKAEEVKWNDERESIDYGSGR